MKSFENVSPHLNRSETEEASFEFKFGHLQKYHYILFVCLPNNDCAKFWRANKEFYGIFDNVPALWAGRFL